jgi:flagellar motor switch protein FliM
MEEQGEQTVLRRKARAARAAQDAREMSPPRALRLALERCAARDLGFVLSVTGVGQARDMADGLVRDLPDRALVLLLDGPDSVPGAMILDMQVCAALVEAQTMGRVAARPAGPRRPTRTDAAIAAPMVAGVLTRMADLLPRDGGQTGAFSFGAMVDDGRALGLALGTGDYRIMRATCCLGPDREGEVILALPDIEEPEQRANGADASAAEGPGPFRDRLLNAPVRLEAVLCRMSVPLSQTRALQVGDALNLPAAAFHDAVLEAAPGRVVARAVLGQMSGQRALRLRGVSPHVDIQALTGGGAATAKTPEMPVPAKLAGEPTAAAQADMAEEMPNLDDLGLSDGRDAPESSAPVDALADATGHDGR